LLALGALYGLFSVGLPLLSEPLRLVLGHNQIVFFGAPETVGLLLLGVGLGMGSAALSLARLDESA